MEPQVTICCNKKENKNSVCKYIILLILLALFTATIGIIIGAALSTTFLNALAALIILAIVLFVLTVIEIIRIQCKNKK